MILRFPRLTTTNLKLIEYHDASYGNLRDGGSQGGYAIVMTDDNKTLFSPITWQSSGIKHMEKSTLAAVETFEACFWLHIILNEVLDHEDQYNLKCRSDGQSLFNSVNSITALTGKRLHVDMTVIT